MLLILSTLISKNMNQFEQLIRLLLERDGFWVKTNVKVNISKEEKRQLGKPSMPRPEIDIVALCVKTNTLYLLEVKSYLDSRGVYPENVQSSEPRWDKYKLLTNEKYQNIIKSTLLHSMLSSGECNEQTRVKFGLVAGKVYKNRAEELKDYCESMNWFFWGSNDIALRIRALEKEGYTDNLIVIVAKMLLRNI